MTDKRMWELMYLIWDMVANGWTKPEAVEALYKQRLIIEGEHYALLLKHLCPLCVNYHPRCMVDGCPANELWEHGELTRELHENCPCERWEGSPWLIYITSVVNSHNEREAAKKIRDFAKRKMEKYNV